jgi:hypothetical protein
MNSVCALFSGLIYTFGPARARAYTASVTSIDNAIEGDRLL